jgi:RecA/RadA recombinase
MSVNTFLNRIRKTTGSESFATSKYGTPDHFIDTGNYALNAICSADLYKGIPAGRTIILYGESSVGKTLLSLEIASNALKYNNYDSIIYFDSENGANYDMVKGRGITPEKIEHVLVENIDDAAVKILTTYAELVEYKKTHPDFKCLMILDSLGSLVPTKIYTDAAKKKFVADQGGIAKQKNALVKSCTIPAVKSGATIIFLSHTYSGPEMYPSKIKNLGGGTQLAYQSSITIQCTKKFEKDEENPKDSDTFYSGNKLKFFTTKNRFCRPFFETELFLDFKKGFSKYDGLFELAQKNDIITSPTSGWYTIQGSDQKLRQREIKTEKYYQILLDLLNDVIKDTMGYSSFSEPEPDEPENISTDSLGEDE